MGAYTVNGETFVVISNGGRDIYWITFGLMLASFIAFTVMTFMRPFRKRAHGYVTTAIVFTAMCAYYAMASNTGYALTGVTNARNTVRSIYYARYIDWFITTPLLLLDLLLMAALPLGDTLWIVFADVAMILTGLFGALTPSHFKWGWYVGGCLLQMFIAWGMLVHGVKGANARGPGVGKLYSFLAVYLVVFWFGYPIVWGLCEGGNAISSTAEAFCYAILDILTKIVFGWIIMLSLGVTDRQSDIERENAKWAPSILDLPTDAPLQLLTGGRDHGIGIAQGHGTGFFWSKLSRAGNKTANDVGDAATMRAVPGPAAATPPATATPAANTAHLQEGPLNAANPASPNVLHTSPP